LRDRIVHLRDRIVLRNQSLEAMVQGVRVFSRVDRPLKVLEVLRAPNIGGHRHLFCRKAEVARSDFSRMRGFRRRSDFTRISDFRGRSGFRGRFEASSCTRSDFRSHWK